MENQDGISIRPMRLKILYTFDNESKTNCLARWPHILEIQTAYLDEETQIGVIELKTCIQAIVSASPELVAKLGKDYTVYAYDYSEYETPLVGQGMLSWVLASASPTPNAPAHQSKTIVTGRVCKISGLFAKGTQETLEVKLRLVPVPTVLQSEYLESMQRYRELSSVIPHDFDAQAWTNFVQENPSLLTGSNSQLTVDTDPSTMDRSGIETLQQLLSESSTPRDFSNLGPESFRADSPAHLTNTAPSRASTPGISRPISRQQKRGAESAFRPSSRASVQNSDFHRQQPSRRGSILSGYGSSDEVNEGPMQKRAKLLRANTSDKVNMNIEKQPGSLRVAASTAASVRIHRPIPMNPSALPQLPNDDPVRPPTPIPSADQGPNYRNRTGQSRLRRESLSNNSQASQSYIIPDDRPVAETSAASPEDPLYGNLTDTPFHMPSSPPVMQSNYPQTSSPMLPPLPDHDSGFMSGPLESLIDDDNQPEVPRRIAPNPHPTRKSKLSQNGAISRQFKDQSKTIMSDNCLDNSIGDPTPSLPPQPRRLASSRPSSRASMRPGSKPLAPAPTKSAEPEPQPRAPIAASDPIQPHANTDARSRTAPCIMSDLPTSATHAPATRTDDNRNRSRTGAKRTKQVQARLDECIRQGTVPPYCENCGNIETPTWRRAWSKVIQGSADEAKARANDPGMLFWESVDVDDDGTVTSFRQFKKSLSNNDKDYVQLLLCNPCGLWLHKVKSMRPEHKWNKPPPKDKRKRQSKRARLTAAPAAASTNSQDKSTSIKCSESSPAPTDASSPAADDDQATPETENGDDKQTESQPPQSPNRRANSAEPPKSADKADRWLEEDPFEALRRAIQSSPARNLDSRKPPFLEKNLTPKPVCRTLFPPSKGEGAMKTLSDALINGIRRSPRSTPKKANKVTDTENNPLTTNDGLDDLFEIAADENGQIEMPGSPSPKQKNRSSTIFKKGSPNSKNTTSGKDPNTNLSPTSRSLRSRSHDPNPKNNNSRLSSLQNSPTSKGYETMDGLVMNLFGSDADSVAEPDSCYPFDLPECPPATGWEDWESSAYMSQDGERRTKQRAKTATTCDSNVDARTNDSRANDTNRTPVPAHSELGDSPFRSILDHEFQDNLNDVSVMPESDFFDASLVDPQLLDMWSKDTDAPPATQSMRELDTTAISALIREVNSADDNA